MFKTRINLYQKQLKPKVDMLSLGSIATLWGLLIVVGAVAWLVIDKQASAHQAELRDLRERNSEMVAQLEILQARVANRKPDPALAERVTLLEQHLSKQQRLLAELASRESLRQQDFATMLTDLASSARDDIWLESFVIGEQSVTFKGQLSYPQALPQWLKALGETDSFTATTFGMAQVYREDAKLYFELSTPRGTDSDAGDVNDIMEGSDE